MSYMMTLSFSIINITFCGNDLIIQKQFVKKDALKKAMLLIIRLHSKGLEGNIGKNEYKKHIIKYFT